MQWCGGGVFALIGGVHRADAVARFERARRFPPAFPGETFRQLFRTFHRADPFAGGGAMLDDDRYDPSGLTLPLLNVYARDDGIVPPGASACLGTLAPAARFDSRVRLSSRELPGGHFDLFTSHRARTELLPDVAAWLIEHTRRPCPA